MSLPQRVPRRRKTGQSIQAAARLLPTDDKRFAAQEPQATGGFAWQARAWHIVKHLGLVHYGMDFIRDNVAQIEFGVATVTDDPEAEPELVDDDDPAALELERLGNGPYGGVSDLMAQLVVHEETAGESKLAVRYERDGEPVAPPEVDRFNQPPEEFEEVWEVLTPQTAKRRENDEKLRPVQAVRIWRPDPERPEFPDSSLRSVLPECEQLLLIQQHITGTLQSRLHMGILLVPEELDPSPPGPPDDGDDDMSPLMRDMFTALSSPIAEPNAAAAIMPYILMGKAELLEAVQHIDLSREFDGHILELAEHLKVTIAGGMDLPAERLLGMGNSNHWNVWYLDESSYTQHIEPDVDLVVRGLLHAWLRPAWQAAGLDPERYTVIADPSKLTMMSAVGMPGDLPIEELQKRAETAGSLVRAGYDAEAVLEVVGLPEMPHTGFLPVTLTERQAPDSDEIVVDTEAVTAAANPDDLGQTLTDIDTEVLTALTDLVDAEVERQTEAAEDRLLEAMAAAGISVDTEPLAQALADANIDAAAIVPDDAFGGVVEPARDIMADGMTRAADAIGVEDARSGAGVIEGGALALSLALTDWLRSRWFSDTPAADANAARFARHGADLTPPGGLIVDAMTTAGGGIGATPGSRGVANAQTIESWLLESGMAVIGYRWVYGAPSESFRPHRRLAGTEFSGPDDERIANQSNRWPHNETWRPGDHRGCQCRWAKILVPAAEVQVG